MFSIPKRFHFLDALRGLAAFIVICFHWRHFWISNTGAALPGPIPSPWFPYYGSLYIFYDYGWVGVYLFFTLSGFVFYWKYAESISRREVKSREFFILRFSRLYPLHVLTLILVAGLQYGVIQKSSTYFTYAHNDIYHFFLNIILAAKWGLEDGFSYNGPIWSVSLEVLVYVIFFYFCLLGLVKKRFLFLMVFVGGCFILFSIHFPLARGLWSFFLGGLVFHGYQWTLEQGKLNSFSRICLWALPVLCVLVVMETYLNLFSEMLQNLFGKDRTGKILMADLGLSAFNLKKIAWTGILFPAIIYTLALLDTQSDKLGSKISFLGNLSYSSYLLHFPLQLVFVLLLGNNVQLFSLSTVFLSFFLILIVLSFISYRYFERPVQNAIRGKFLKRRA